MDRAVGVELDVLDEPLAFVSAGMARCLSVVVVSTVTIRLSSPLSFLGFGDSARRDERGGGGPACWFPRKGRAGAAGIWAPRCDRGRRKKSEKCKKGNRSCHAALQTRIVQCIVVECDRIGAILKKKKKLSDILAAPSIALCCCLFVCLLVFGVGYMSKKNE